MIGKVISAKMKQTVVVRVERKKTHPLYKKSFKRGKNYLVHDSQNVKLGDVVEFVKVKPISRMKHWQITKVVGRDITEIMEEQLKEEVEKQVAEVLPVEKEESSNMNQEASLKAKENETKKKGKKG